MSIDNVILNNGRSLFIFMSAAKFEITKKCRFTVSHSLQNHQVLDLLATKS